MYLLFVSQLQRLAERQIWADDAAQIVAFSFDVSLFLLLKGCIFFLSTFVHLQ